MYKKLRPHNEIAVPFRCVYEISDKHPRHFHREVPPGTFSR